MAAQTNTTADKGGATPLLQVRNLKKYFPIVKGILGRHVGDVKAVDDVSFDVHANETVGLVGESGCGKTTTGRTLLRLIEPSSGEVLFKGQDIVKLDTEGMRAVRRDLQIIFQDPFSSLNPRMTIEGIIGEALEFHKIAAGKERRDMVEELLIKVGLQPSYITRYPHEFSGGQRQRIGIARALALKPEFIVCDEAVSALDVSVQAQVINLLQDLQDEFNLSYLFIAHDLSVVRHISDRIAVMYLGQIVELGPSESLFEAPLHPYSQALLSAIPHPDPRRKKQRVILEGDVPSPINPPSGCRFHTRCPTCYAPCGKIEPRVVEHTPGNFVRCHLYDPDHAPKEQSVWDRLPSAAWARANAPGADLEATQTASAVVEEDPSEAALERAIATAAAAREMGMMAAASEMPEVVEPAPLAQDTAAPDTEVAPAASQEQAADAASDEAQAPKEEPS
jgi:oligopeptide/dipeptide ABC transporter ATP-binding protein